MGQKFQKLSAAIRLVRPHQYVKNGFVLLPPFFGGKLTDLHSFFPAILVFFFFCLASSSVYVFNDLRDVEMDRLHPKKCLRPIASGEISSREAVLLMAALILVTVMGSALLLERKVQLVLIGYFALNVLYTLYLKNFAILDLFCVSFGFVFRIIAGTWSCHLEISHWLVLMTFLLAMFLALAKRRDDLVIAQNCNGARKCLDGYSFEFISLCMVMTAAVTIVSYILYTVSPEVTSRIGSKNLYLTVFLVIAGIFRYLQITFLELGSGSPTQVLLKDFFLQIVLLVWIVSFYAILYM